MNRRIPIEHIKPLYYAVKADGSEAYVDYIVKHRKNPKTQVDEYLVRWIGTDEQSWVQVGDIRDYSFTTRRRPG